MFARRVHILVYVLLTIVVIAVFSRTLGNGFTNYDDDTYVTENLHVRTGLTLSNLVWAASAMHASNWHPMTWASHMLDCTLYGLNPTGHHATNLLLHLANTFLLYGLLRRMTKSVWRSALVAALFAVHPLHVESVAWIAERKDLLSAFFWLLATWAYVRYSEKPGMGRYLLVVVIFALGLMSKPMIVTLPLTLLLLDYWPLNRFGKNNTWPILREKIPMFIISAAGCAVTYMAQKGGMAVGTLDQLPLGIRIANVATAYVAYIGKMLFPIHLSVFYPHPKGTLPLMYVVGSWALLVCITVVVMRLRNRRYLLVGWLWYLITLAPVIGLVQVGWQAMADRYTYMPLVGLFVMVAWGVPELLGKGTAEGSKFNENLKPETRNPKPPNTLMLASTVVACVMVAALGATASRQVGYWKNSTTLFTHALRVTRNNPVAENNMGIVLVADGKFDEAIAHHLRAVKLKPGWADARYSLGTALLHADRVDEALRELSLAIDINPNYAQAHNNLGAALLMEGRTDEAIRHFNEAIRIKPDYPNARRNLETALSEK